MSHPASHRPAGHRPAVRRPALALLAMVLVLLTGCAQIPTSGPIEVAPGLEQETDSGVEIAPEPPSAGASPRTVVEGFLQAIANYQPGYTVAREYLAEDVRESWQPESQVLIYADGYSVATTPDSATLTAPLFGRIAQDGSFSRIQRELKLDFGLVRDANGQWRIGNPPDGVIMTQYTFENFYSGVNMYFYDPDYTTMVADPVFVPRGNRNATTLLQRLLNGPTEWIAPVVTSAIPPQTRLNVQSASVDSAGVVEVSLTDAVRSLSEEQRTRLAAQFVWTLRQLEGLSGLRITVNGEPFAIPEQDPTGVVSLDLAESLGPAPPSGTDQVFGIGPAGVVEVIAGPNGSDLAPVPGGLGELSSASDLAVSADAARAAVVSADESVLTEATLAEGRPRTVSDTLTNLLRPDYSGSTPQELWFVGDNTVGEQQIRLADDEGRVAAVPNTLTDNARIQNFAISPDGLRFAAVRERPDGSHELGVGLVDRTGDIPSVNRWKQVSLDEPGRGSSLSAVDVAWLDTTTLMVLTSNGDAGRTPVEVDQSGSIISDMGTAEDWDVWAVAAASGQSPTRATVAGRGAWEFTDDYQWTPVSPDLRAVAYPG